jgi:hypothetical protein
MRGREREERETACSGEFYYFKYLKNIITHKPKV